MDRFRDSFKKINFDKNWDEDDWETFFQAQDQLVKEVRPGAVSTLSARSPDPVLSFRQVLRRFGMDPDNPAAPPSHFKSEAPAPKAAFWEEGVAVDTLAIFNHAREYATRFAYFCNKNYGKSMRKIYKSPAHLERRRLLNRILAQAPEISRNIAAGHDIGYSPDAVRGNIARCKRALGHADACLGLVSRLKPRRLPPGEHARLFRETLHLRNQLAEWISFLRERFVPKNAR